MIRVIKMQQKKKLIVENLIYTSAAENERLKDDRGDKDATTKQKN